ncbi:MAG: HEAT repeat domain-containing protein [Deltaproteobacteria bacterium]|nr:HEAT repeat domain-containing protein [Deltaproteobacteria bacterium]
MGTAEFRVVGGRGDREAFVRDLLAAFSQSLIQTLLKLGFYDLDHPSARDSLASMHQMFKSAIAGHDEVTYIAVRSVEKPEVLVVGYFPEPVPLSDVMRTGTAELFVPKFLDYFIRHRIYSLTLNQRLEADEMRGFVDAMFKSLQPDVPADAVRAAIALGGVTNISLLFVEDAVGAGRRISWRAELALTRLSKDLAKIPLYTNISAEKAAALRTQVIGDVLRPLKSGEFVAELLVNTDLIEAELKKQGFADPLREIAAATAPEVRYDAIRQLNQIRSRIATEGHPRPRERADLATAAADATKALALEMVRADRPEDYDGLEALFRARVLGLEDMPARFKNILTVRVQAASMLGRRDEYLAWLREEQIPEMLSQGLAIYPEASREIVRQGGLQFLIDAFEIMAERLADRTAPTEVRRAIAMVANALIANNVLTLLKEKYLEAKKEDRVRFKGAFRLFGSRGAVVYVEILRESEDRWVRKSSLEALESMGAEVENVILAEIMKPQTPWFLQRNLLQIIEKIGTSHSAGALEQFLSHSDPRVRTAAVGAASEVLGPAAEARIIRMLSDPDGKVLEVVIERLGGLRSKHPAVVDLYRKVFDPEKDAAYPEPLRRAACIAIARTGNIPLGKDFSAEDLLCTALKGQERKVLGMSVSRKPYFTPIVRGMICEALSQIGGDKTLETLEEIAKREGDPDAQPAKRALMAMKAKKETNKS